MYKLANNLAKYIPILKTTPLFCQLFLAIWLLNK